MELINRFLCIVAKKDQFGYREGDKIHCGAEIPEKMITGMLELGVKEFIVLMEDWDLEITEMFSHGTQVSIFNTDWYRLKKQIDKLTEVMELLDPSIEDIAKAICRDKGENPNAIELIGANFEIAIKFWERNIKQAEELCTAAKGERK